MTIFDSIRYPISDKPKIDELAVLPHEILNPWWLTDVPYSFTGPRRHYDAIDLRYGNYVPVDVMYDYITDKVTDSGKEKFIKLLRKRIADYQT